MFYVIVEYMSGTEVEFGPYGSYEDALETAYDAMDEPNATYYIYKDDALC